MQILIDLAFQGLLFLSFYLAMLPFFILIHEGLHIVILKDVLKVDYKYKWIKHGFAFTVYSKYFNENFLDMVNKKQRQYFYVAIAPYIFIIPFTYVMFQQTNLIISMTGLMLLVAQFMNLPLEFIFIQEKPIVPTV